MTVAVNRRPQVHDPCAPTSTSNIESRVVSKQQSDVAERSFTCFMSAVMPTDRRNSLPTYTMTPTSLTHPCSSGGRRHHHAMLIATATPLDLGFKFLRLGPIEYTIQTVTLPPQPHIVGGPSSFFTISILRIYKSFKQSNGADEARTRMVPYPQINNVTDRPRRYEDTISKKRSEKPQTLHKCKDYNVLGFEKSTLYKTKKQKPRSRRECQVTKSLFRDC